MIDEPKQNQAVLVDGLISSLSSPSAGDIQKITYDIAPSAILKVLVTIAAVWLAVRVFSVILLVVLSLMLVAAFNPLIRKLQTRLRRSWAIASLVSAVVLACMGAVVLLIPPLMAQGSQLFKHAPQYSLQIQQILASHHIRVNIQGQVQRIVADPGIAAPKVVNVLSNALEGVTAFLTVAILTIYLLIEGQQVGTAFMRLLPRRERLPARNLVMEIGEEVGSYMRGQIITSVLAGVYSFITLWILGIPGALALGVLAALADAVPFVGVIIALVPAALVAVTVSVGKAGIVIVAYLVYHQLESHVIAPKVYGNALGLSLTVIVISLLVGAELMGTVGALLALPVAAAIPSIVRYFQSRHDRQVLSDAEPMGV